MTDNHDIYRKHRAELVRFATGLVGVRSGPEGLPQISSRPIGATSRLEWCVVDLFLTDAGEIAGVILDLGA